MIFEQSNWDPTCQEGLRLLNDAIEILPDNKLAEDTHQRLRDAERAVSTDSKLSVSSSMLTCITGGVLEQRGLNDVQVTPETLARTTIPSKLEGFKHKTKSSSYKTTEEMEKLMHPRTPTAPQPQSLVVSVAATAWLYHHRRLTNNRDPLNNGWHASLLQTESIIKHRHKPELYMVLYVAEWAALCCPLKNINSMIVGMEAFVLDFPLGCNSCTTTSIHKMVIPLHVSNFPEWNYISYQTRLLRDTDGKLCCGYLK